MKKTKKALASLAIAGMTLTMIPFNSFADDTVTVNTRLAGITAAQTAQVIAQEGWTASLNAVIAPDTTDNMVDTLAAAPLAAALNAPILLTGSSHLSSKAEEEITRLGVKVVYVTSGQAVIKAGVITELQTLGVDVVKLGGFDQYETSVNIAKEITKIAPTTSIFIANGEAARVAQDALSVAAIAGAQKQPLLLTQKGQLPQVVADYIASIKANVTTSYITGGTGVVSDEVEAQLPGTIYRNAGLDAYETNLEVLKNFTTLDYARLFVANGETMIDALAGAPLAALSKSPIVLVNDSVETAITDYLYTKITDKTVVTALGGKAVVPETIRATIANSGQLNVTDVAGSTDELFKEDSDPVLGITVGGVEKTISELAAAGFTVEFKATEPVFYGDNYDSSDGIVNMDAANVDLTEGAIFNYKVVISKGEIVATSDFKKVTIKAGSSTNSGIESAKIFLANDGEIDGANVEVKSSTLTVDDDAYLRVRGVDATSGYGSITAQVKYNSSDPAIASIDKSPDSLLSYDDFDYAKIVLSGQTGTVTITISISNGTTKTLTLEIVDEKRKISASDTQIARPGQTKLSGTKTSETFAVTVKDQFGDPIKDYTINPRDAISSSDVIAQCVAVNYDEASPVGYDADVSDDDASTDYKGRVVVLVKGGKDEGTATLRIQDEDSNTLNSISVSNRVSSRTSTDYSFALAPFRTKTLDASDSVDNVTYLIINAYDSSGYKTNDADLSDLTIKIDGNKIVDDATNKYITVDTTNLNSGGYIKVIAKKITTSAISIALYQKNSNIQFASTSITVKDTRAKITSVKFESGIPIIYSASGIKLDRILKKSGIRTDNYSSVTFEYADENHVLIRGIDDIVIGNLKLSVLDGDLYPTFATDENDDIRIILEGSDDGENGIIRLTVNKLTGEDVNGIPGTATTVGRQNITVTDLVN